MIETLIAVVIIMAVAGLLMWLFNQFVTMEPKYKGAINAVVGVVVFIVVLVKLLELLK